MFKSYEQSKKCKTFPSSFWVVNRFWELIFHHLINVQMFQLLLLSKIHYLKPNNPKSVKFEELWKSFVLLPVCRVANWFQELTLPTLRNLASLHLLVNISVGVRLKLSNYQNDNVLRWEVQRPHRKCGRQRSRWRCVRRCGWAGSVLKPSF